MRKPPDQNKRLFYMLHIRTSIWMVLVKGFYFLDTVGLGACRGCIPKLKIILK